jgi:hypothetical protein
MLPIFMLATILALSAIDYDHLARTIQVEAARGTMDEYCVAVSVLNRVRSPKFPNTVASTTLVNRLKSSEGRENLLKAYSIIGDRTDFKGQSQLRHRVASEDPMCHTKGNFYHYFWQT